MPPLVYLLIWVDIGVLDGSPPVRLGDQHEHLVYMWRSWVRVPPKAPVVSLSKKLAITLLLSTGWFLGNGFERDFTIELKSIEGLMED